MKKLLLFLILFFVSLFSPVTRLHAEEITSYDVDISIQKDGRFTVSEKILYDFGTLEKHGIFRNIPYKKQNSEGKQFLMELSNIQVVDEKDQRYQFVTSNVGTNSTLKIGDPNKTITGKHTYNIFYTVSGGITYFSQHDELYWQVTGTEWAIPIDRVSVVVTLPDSVDEPNIRMTCYTGSASSNQSDC
ncbi:DUF2207 domain-containing protein, partial [Patescibacteria group bacterium]|nr:DUF2207 domain-containing protein [Patescibacteria group bacterium]